MISSSLRNDYNMFPKKINDYNIFERKKENDYIPKKMMKEQNKGACSQTL